MSERSNVGKYGETLVANFLKKQGNIIVRRNYNSRYGEIDIVAENEEYILFVEVKTRKSGSIISPADAVSHAKQKRIVLTAKEFISKLRVGANYRFDVAEVFYHIDENGQFKASLNYIKNAFTDEVIEDIPF